MTTPTLFRGWEMPETGILGLTNRLLSTVLLFILFATGCTELSEYDSSQVRTALNDSLTTTSESWDVELKLMQDGRTRILVDGTYAISYQRKDEKLTKIDGPVYVQLYDSVGAVETEAWSKRAVYLEQEREFELYDSVRVHTAANRQLYTEYLKWSQDTDRITSPDFVIIITPTDSIAGQGFDGLTDLSSYTIAQPRGRVIID